MSEGIVTIQNGSVLEIHIDRAEKKNALTGRMYQLMTAAFAKAASCDEIGAILIVGRGDTFCAGNDLKDFMAGPEGTTAAFKFIRAIAAFDKPIVAAVQGMAVGIGTTMLFHCDLIYATPDARFVMPFVNLGIAPEAGSSFLAPAVLGHAKAAAMLLLGEPMNSQEADRAGLITALVQNEKLLDHARGKAAAFMAKPPRALKVTRQLIKGDLAALFARIDEEERLILAALASREAQEAVTAIVERRPPVFQ